MSHLSFVSRVVRDSTGKLHRPSSHPKVRFLRRDHLLRGFGASSHPHGIVAVRLQLNSSTVSRASSIAQLSSSGRGLSIVSPSTASLRSFSSVPRASSDQTRGREENYFVTSPKVPTRIAVVGAGQMGVGVAICAAKMFAIGAPSTHNEVSSDGAKEPKVALLDVSTGQLDNARRFIGSWLNKEQGKSRITPEESQRVEALLTYSTVPDLSSSNSATNGEGAELLMNTDFCVEAAPEDFSLKSRVFEVLDTMTPPNTILASNTSSISITALSRAASSRPEKVVGMHFMNPVPVMPLVEIIRGLATDDMTLKITIALAQQMGKTTACSLDRPGFVSNRVLMPYINEAILTVQEGTATAEDVDTIMRLGTNVPMGPLRLADFIGLDTCLSIMKVLHRDFGDSKYRPAPLLQQHVDIGWLGKKVGRGFYRYNVASK